MLWRQHGIVSQKYKDSQMRRRRLVLFLFGLVLLILIGGLFWVGYSKTFHINNITFSGVTTAKETLVKQIVLDRLNTKLFFVIPVDNTVLVPKRDIKNNLLESFAQIQNVEIALINEHTINVAVAERKPVGVWCENSEVIDEKETSQKCFFLDEFGYIFGRAPDFSGNLFFRYFGGNVSSTIIGSYYLPTEIFSERIFFITSLRTLGLNPISATWNKNGDSYIYLSPKKDVGLRGDILFNNDDSLGSVFEHLSLTLTAEDFAEINMRIIDVEYIDLRSPNKIFYKLQ